MTKKKSLSREAAGLDKPITAEKVRARKSVRKEAAGTPPKRKIVKKK